MKTTIDIKGISTTSAYVDGDCMSMVNLRKKNGVLKPVTPRKVINTLTAAYDMLFVHHVPTNVENYLGVKHAGTVSSLYWKAKTTDTSLNEAFALIGTTNMFPKITALQQIGNTLSVITEESISYLLWSNGGYKVLGELPELPNIKFSAITPSGGSNANYGDLGSGDTIYKCKDGRLIALYTTGRTNNKENMLVNTRLLINETINKCITDTSLYENVRVYPGIQLFDCHIVRYALRLYDDTLIKHSSPLLIAPPDSIFAQKQFTYVFNINNDTELSEASRLSIKFYNLQMDYLLDSLSSWSDIIKSVDIFLSPSLGYTSAESIANNFADTMLNEQQSWENIIKTIVPKNIEDTKTQSLFYLIKSIPLDGGTSTIFPGSDTDKNNLLNLVNKELMSDDSFSNNKIGASKSFVYNGRLNLGSIKSTLYKGYASQHFQWNSIYNGTAQEVGTYEYCIETEIKIDGVTNIVRSTNSNYQHNASLNPYLSYPDARATKMTIISSRTGKKMKEFVLKAHDNLNLAYYINETLTPNTVDVTTTRTTTATTVVISEKNKLKTSSLNNPFSFPAKNTNTIGTGQIIGITSNSMRTSEGQFGQYPIIIFTSDLIYALDTGANGIVYSNISPISYETPVSDIICSTPNGIIFIGKRGLFVVNGSQVELITAQLEQEPLTVALNMPTSLEVPTIGNIKTWNDWFKTYLKNDLNEVTDIVYDNQNNEIIIINPEYDYNFVYNLDSKEIYQQTEVIDNVVGNVYPELLVTEGLSVKDYGQKKMTTDTIPVAVKAAVSFVTRPFNFGTTEIKKLERTILRARLHQSDEIIAMNHCSNDGVNFVPVQGRTFVSGNYRDIDLGLMARNKHRLFMYCFTAKLDEDSQIGGIDTEVVAEYDNEKMR